MLRVIQAKKKKIYLGSMCHAVTPFTYVYCPKERKPLLAMSKTGVAY